MDLEAVKGDIERVIVTEEQLQARIKELAAQVDKDYEGKDLLLVGVLKGAVMAVADFHVHYNATLIWIGWRFLHTVLEQSPAV